MSSQPRMTDEAGPGHVPAPAALSFEEALARLEQIVLRIESGEAGLEESLRLFEEGVALARTCRAQLDRAEARIRVLVEGADGELLERELAAAPGDAAERGLEGEGDGA
ncbi:MAG: exodeoxyribonuclease VII small subunit [Limnochordales bacterium]|nr:exodeoxyribonuclease VII small subunit [Limnochordales bacterium]